MGWSPTCRLHGYTEGRRWVDQPGLGPVSHRSGEGCGGQITRLPHAACPVCCLLARRWTCKASCAATIDQTYLDACIYTLANAAGHSHMHALVLAYADMLACTHPCTRACTRTHTRACTHACKHACRMPMRVLHACVHSSLAFRVLARSAVVCADHSYSLRKLVNSKSPCPRHATMFLMCTMLHGSMSHQPSTVLF